VKKTTSTTKKPAVHKAVTKPAAKTTTAVAPVAAKK
jgi:hypothetical protein